MLRYYFALCCIAFPLAVTKVVRLDIEVKEDSDFSPNVMAKLEVDKQVVYGLVDTAAAPLFFVWKDWYERSRPHGCEHLIFKCYECKPGPCKEGITTNIPYADGSVATIFKKTGKLNLGQAGDFEIEFGLTANYKYSPGDESPHASIGLGPPMSFSQPYKPLIQQLLSKPPASRPISSSAFSMYLKPGDALKGKLILGGSDPSLYIHPLSFAPTKGRFVTMTGFRVGSGSFPKVPVAAAAEIDSGAGGFFIDHKLFADTIRNIGTRGTRKVKITQDGASYEVACSDRQYMPTLTFFVKGVSGKDIALDISPTSYVRVIDDPHHGQYCRILIQSDSIGVWGLGYAAMIGNYFLFDWQKGTIGVAKLK